MAPLCLCGGSRDPLRPVVSNGRDTGQRGRTVSQEWERVLDLRSRHGRNPVAKAFVGSNPTPRTNVLV